MMILLCTNADHDDNSTLSSYLANAEISANYEHDEKMKK